jgi:hypothetical protein
LRCTPLAIAPPINPPTSAAPRLSAATDPAPDVKMIDAAKAVLSDFDNMPLTPYRYVEWNHDSQFGAIHLAISPLIWLQGL